MKRLAIALFVLFTFSSKAQTIFYYGNDSVSAEEYMRAWEKNNTGEKSEKAFREYLQLFINSRLKIKEAKTRGYDTLPQFIADISNLRQQIMPSYLNDNESVSRLVKEAFERSSKDIHLAHIFIGPPTPSVYGRIDATYQEKANEALAALNEGKDFAEVARKFSADPSAQQNGGDIGWITVFSLPYELENLAYATPSGRHSGIYASKAGYHIFKNLGERKARGRMRAAQILLAFPPGADENTKQDIKQRADSIYERLLKGDDFAKLAVAFSNDVVSAAANGQMVEFGIGQYDPVFENAVFSIPADGDITKPFITAHGYHIVKRLNKSTTPEKINEETEKWLQSKVEQSDRMVLVRKELIKKRMQLVPITKMPFENINLWAYSDSLLNFNSPGRVLPINNTTVLLKVGDRNVNANDWIGFAQAFRYKPDGTGLKSYPQLFEEFVEAQAIDYYQNHLEEYDAEFARQLEEFKDGNLFFEIMQKEVWGPAQSDTAALRRFFNEDPSRYNWKPSAQAVMFYATDESNANIFRDQLKKSPDKWRELANQFSENVAVDSSRFELAQLPNPTKKKIKAGKITQPLVNKIDNSASFAYIISINKNTEPRSFEEARGMVINDYQAQLENKWIEELKKKFPVKINEEVVKKVIDR